MRRRGGAALAAALVLCVAAPARADLRWDAFPRVAEPAAVFQGPVAPADCGPGSAPETGVQGEVPMADRRSGRSLRPYSCNLERVGQWQGEGTS